MIGQLRIVRVLRQALNLAYLVRDQFDFRHGIIGLWKGITWHSQLNSEQPFRALTRGRTLSMKASSSRVSDILRVWRVVMSAAYLRWAMCQ